MRAFSTFALKSSCKFINTFDFRDSDVQWYAKALGGENCYGRGSISQLNLWPISPFDFISHPFTCFSSNQHQGGGPGNSIGLTTLRRRSVTCTRMGVTHNQSGICMSDQPGRRQESPQLVAGLVTRGNHIPPIEEAADWHVRTVLGDHKRQF